MHAVEVAEIGVRGAVVAHHAAHRARLCPLGAAAEPGVGAPPAVHLIVAPTTTLKVELPVVLVLRVGGRGKVETGVAAVEAHRPSPLQPLVRHHVELHRRAAARRELRTECHMIEVGGEGAGAHILRRAARHVGFRAAAGARHRDRRSGEAAEKGDEHTGAPRLMRPVATRVLSSSLSREVPIRCWRFRFRLGGAVGGGAAGCTQPRTHLLSYSNFLTE